MLARDVRDCQRPWGKAAVTKCESEALVAANACARLCMLLFEGGRSKGVPSVCTAPGVGYQTRRPHPASLQEWKLICRQPGVSVMADDTLVVMSAHMRGEGKVLGGDLSLDAIAHDLGYEIPLIPESVCGGDLEPGLLEFMHPLDPYLTPTP